MSEHGHGDDTGQGNGSGHRDANSSGHDSHDSPDNYDNHDTHDPHHDNHDTHDHHHHDLDELGVAVLTVSSSRTLDDDPAGDAIQNAVEADGHTVTVRELVPDDYDRVQDTVDRFVSREDTECVVTTGGTGVTPDDVTPEAVDPLVDKRLPGFGEVFRRLSYEEVGTRVVGTRAFAGIADGVPVFCLPGSASAVVLGTEEVVLAEATHLAGLSLRETQDAGDDDEGTPDDNSKDNPDDNPNDNPNDKPDENGV